MNIPKTFLGYPVVQCEDVSPEPTPVVKFGDLGRVVIPVDVTLKEDGTIVLTVKETG